MTRTEALRQAWPCGIATYRLRGIEDAIQLATSCQQYWFRGHAQQFEFLVPKVHREPFYSGPSNIEFRAAQRFRLRSRTFATTVPDWDAHLLWLLMMQHHGVPTRLLDWTESVLVALFFASGAPDHDGEIWCMNPSRLNYHSDNRMICMPDDPRVSYLAAQVFLDAKPLSALAESLGFESPPNAALALIPPFEFPRMAAQKSRFTIHPPPGDDNCETMIEFLLRDERNLVRYEVPQALKPALKKDLSRLGISREILFHSLESLAETVADEIIEEDFYLTGPPHCNSEFKPSWEMARPED
jgi:hypothetical protein